MEERTISVREMFLRISLAWKKIIIFALCGAILVEAAYTGLSLVKKYRNGTPVGISEYDPEYYKSQMTKRDIKFADEALQNREDLLDTYDVFVEYYMHSALYKIDASAVPTVSLSYIVDAEESSKILNVYDVIKTELFIENNLNKYSESTSDAVDSNYISELLSVELEDNLITVVIRAVSEEDALGIGNEIKTVINSTVLPAELVGNSSVSLISEEYTVRPDNTVVIMKQDAGNKLTELVKSIQNCDSSLSSKGKKYFNLMIADPEDIKTVDMRSPSYFSIKYGVLGAALGLILGLLVTVWPVLSGVKILSESDIDDLGIKLLGITFLSKPKGIYKKLYKRELKLSDEDKFTSAAFNATSILNKKGIDSVLVSDFVSDDENEFAENVSERINKNGIVSDVLYGPLYSTEAMQKTAKAKSVILVVKSSDSLYRDVNEEIKLCYNLGVEVIGAILLR